MQLISLDMNNFINYIIKMVRLIWCCIFILLPYIVIVKFVVIISNGVLPDLAFNGYKLDSEIKKWHWGLHF